MILFVSETRNSEKKVGDEKDQDDKDVTVRDNSFVHTTRSTGTTVLVLVGANNKNRN